MARYRTHYADCTDGHCDVYDEGEIVHGGGYAGSGLLSIGMRLMVDG